MMRIVDVLFGLPYILLVVLLAIAIDAGVSRWQAGVETESRVLREAYVAQRLADQAHKADPSAHSESEAALRLAAAAALPARELSPATRQAIGVLTLVVAIGGVSWLTMARVIRGQVLSLKAQPFIEAARAAGVSTRGIFLRHLLPNLVGPIVVYSTLTVPQAILQESFLSFLGIGVRPPLPSWGNLAADGLSELNPFRSHWWLLLFPCLLLGSTLLALNFVGEALRESLDPKRARRR
jgi:ABC-type dipeptide/oligopeptide/nickel transport system permease subunit